MASFTPFREIRSILLQSFDDGDISEDEFLLLYGVNTSKTQIFLMNVIENLTLMIWMTVSVYPTFAFIRVTFPSFVRPYIFLNYFICQQGTICDGIEGLCIALRRFA